MTRRLISTVIIPAAAFVIAAAWLMAPDLSAQAPSRERTVFVSAIDDKGEPVEGLGPGDFIIREDGQRREVLRVSRAIEPMDIALLIDTSASASNAISSIRDGVRGFVAKMAPQNRIAIIGNSGGPGVLAADACTRAGLRVAELSELTRAALTALVPAAATGNPIDLLATVGLDAFERALDCVLADANVDGVVAILFRER